MEKWKDLNIKDKIAIVSAIAAFIIGWALSIWGFIVPPLGEVSSSVLWLTGQGLIYASSVFGIASYFSTETMKMKRDLREYVEKKSLQNNEDNA